MKRKHIQGCNCCGCNIYVHALVLDSATNAPLPGAAVTVFRPGYASVNGASGPAGTADLVIHVPGGWTVGASKSGYGSDSIDISVGTCGNSSSVTLHLTPSVTIAGCLCQAIPPVLRMMPTDPTLNGGMFQPCTLAYGTTPPEYARLALGAQCFLSTTSFTDQIGESFRYYFACTHAVLINGTQDNFTLTRVYAHSIFGNPYRDTTRYTWPLTLSGNTCSPFLLTKGQIYQGGDTRSQIVVSE
jgi:hypothetical protein